MDTASIIQLITHLPPEYWYGAAFLGAFLLGENVIIGAFVFAATQPMLFPGTFLATLSGTLAADIFWYLVTVYIISKTRLKKILQKKRTNLFLRSILETADRHPYLILLCIKFLVGVRIILSISIITRTKISLGKFLFFDTLGAIIFIALLGSIGWFASTGALAVSAYHTLITTLITIIILSLTFHILSKVLSKLFFQKKA